MVQILLKTGILLSCLLSLANAQDDSARSVSLGEKSWAKPLVEGLLINSTIASYNIWVTQSHFAQISFNSVDKNMTESFVWDTDKFETNQIEHPYQGSLYYSAARFYGLNYYQSLGYTALGSLEWEYAGEILPPSFNDLITTTLGGAILGEISFRLAESVLDENTGGSERVFREVFAGVLDPVMGVNRLINGNTFKRPALSPDSKTHRENKMMLRVSMGATLTGVTPLRHQVPKAENEFLLRYGDAFNAEKPFDYFIFTAGANFARSPIAVISARGQLWKHDMAESQHGRWIFTVGQNFDFINGGVYKIGSSGFGTGFSNRYTWDNEWYFLSAFQIGGIALGGSSTEYFPDHERDYNLGPGFFETIRVAAGHTKYINAAFVADRYWLHTVSGARGNELIGLGSLELSRSIYRSLGGILAYTFFDRTSWYESFPNKRDRNGELKFSLSCRLP